MDTQTHRRFVSIDATDRKYMGIMGLDPDDPHTIGLYSREKIMRQYYQQYRRSPYSIIISRWKRHAIHLLALLGLLALAYAFWSLRP